MVAMGLHTVTVTGSFQRNGLPYPGKLIFIPDRLWVEDGEIRWATLAPIVWTDEYGVFTTTVTATDSDCHVWTYRVVCPKGTFRLQVPYDENGHSLKELIDANHAQPRP